MGFDALEGRAKESRPFFVQWIEHFKKHNAGHAKTRKHTDPNESDSSDGIMAAGAGRQACGLSGGGGLLGHEAGSTKEIALLKAVAESLRAGLREKEDSITELVSVL